MKRVFLFLSAALLVLSCGNKDNGGSDTPEKPQDNVVMEDPVTKEAAQTIEFKEEELPKYEDNEGLYEVLYIEFTEGGRYILRRRVLAVKSEVGDIETLVGGYTENEGEYKMEGVGTLAVSEDKKEVEWKPDGEENQDNVTTTQPIVTETTTSNTQENNIARTWKIDDGILQVTGQGVNIKKSFNGDLYALAEYASKNGVSQLSGKLDQLRGYNVKDIIFTGDGTFCISFTGAKAIDGGFTLNPTAKTITYDFSGSSNPFFHGTGSGEFDFPANKKLTLSMSLSLEGYDGSLQLSLSEVN